MEVKIWDLVRYNGNYPSQYTGDLLPEKYYPVMGIMLYGNDGGDIAGKQFGVLLKIHGEQGRWWHRIERFAVPVLEIPIEIMFKTDAHGV